MDTMFTIQITRRSQQAKVWVLLFVLTIFSALGTCSAEDQDAIQLGREVLAIQKAIAHPDDPSSIDAVKKLGLITAHYSMVRGWLVQELNGAESIKSAQKPDSRTPEIDARIAFLKKAIRAIDLE